MRTAVIANPKSAGGKTGRQWPEIASALGARLGQFDVRLTERQGHATVLARDLLDNGYCRIIAAGGDGTISETANGFLRDDQPINPEACLGILPLGTGGDFRRSLQVPTELDQAIEVIATGRRFPIDVGKAEFRDEHGFPLTRYFVNLLSFGMGGEVAARSQNLLNPLGGTASFLYATAAGFLSYRLRTVRLTLDGSPEALSFRVYNIAAGNGRFHGGGMQACPTAVLDDGVLEITVIDNMSRFEAVRDFRVLYSDNVYRHPKVKHLRASRLHAEADTVVRLEIDGEPLGTLPLEIMVLPRVLPVLVPLGAV